MAKRGNLDFTAFTIKHNGLANRIISDIGLTPAFDPASIKDNNLPYEITNKKALWDTGATNCVVTPDTAKEMQLTPSGATEVVHFGGKKQVNTYLVNFFLPNKVLIAGVRVSESDIIIDDFGVIIGMDIITRGDFTITNKKNITTMSFRFPSIHTIDYVVDANKIIYAGVDKYGPCPCGSVNENGKRKKFKACHGEGW